MRGGLVLGYIVKHRVFGQGEVKKIEDGFIRINFNNEVKSFQFPKAFGIFLETDDPQLMSLVNQAKKAEESKALSENKPITQTMPMPQVFNRLDRLSGYHNKSVSAALVGDRAQTISVNSEAEMFEIAGYMATPGRVNSFEAEVPKDGRDKTFESMFPGQTYRPIEMSFTPSGMPNKLSPQFRINFLSTRNCPSVLLRNMGKGNGSCVARINKSRFVLEMVQHYGFKFGDQQDIVAIREIASKNGYLEDFERGYKR